MTSTDAESKGAILVVEDDQVNLKLMRAMIENAGYQVSVVADGFKCLDAVASVRPDLILMDIVMPGMSGIETCRRLRSGDAMQQDIPVIFVTAQTEDEMLQQAFDCGGNDYVRKPISRVELLVRIRTALNQRRAALQTAEKEKLRGALETAGGVCHELNQPLQYIMGAVQLILMDLEADNLLRPQMEKICSRVNQMGQITRKLAEITCFRTRKYPGGQQVIDLDRSSAS